MARISFRQGIVNHGQTPTQSFFLQQNGSNVHLFVSPQQTIIVFADGTKDYLFTEASTILNAWVGLTVPGNNWLYWDINRITGVRTFGSTILAPIIQPTNPGASDTGQMWFDTSTGNLSSGQMHEYNGSVFVPVLRVFAAIYNGTTIVSPVDGVSVEANFTGTQVMLSGIVRNTGALAFDSNGLPIINQDGKFFTTEDLFTTGVPDASALKINNIVQSAKADEPIGAFQAVVFTDFNQIGLASPFDFLDKVYGIVEQSVPTSSIANVVTEGIIFNELWDFSDTAGNPNLSGVINTPIYITSVGQLTTNIAMSIPNAVVMGAVIGQHSIIFSPGLYGSTGMIVSSGNHGALTGLLDDDHTQYLDNTRGDVRYYEQTVADGIFVAVAGDTMTGSLILDADPVANLEAATKQYVDGVVGGGINNVVEDLTPQLGGDLDVNSSDIVSTGGANINILPDGAGNVMLGTMTFDSNQLIAGGQDNYVLTYDNGTGLISLEAAAGGGGGANNWVHANNGADFDSAAVATGLNATAIGRASSASGVNATAIGAGNSATEDDSFVYGSNRSNIRAGMIARGIGRHSDGAMSATSGEYHLRGEITGLGTIDLTWGNDLANNPGNTMSFPSGAVYMFEARVVAVAPDDATIANAGYFIRGGFNIGGVLGTPTKEILWEDAVESINWDANIMVSGGSSGVSIEVTSDYFSNVRWYCNFSFWVVNGVSA